MSVCPDGTTAPPEPPLGAARARAGEPLEKAGITHPEGSLLALYTPGLLQRYPGDRGRERLAGLLAGFAGCARQACARGTGALLPRTPQEDAAVQTARTHTLGPDRVVWCAATAAGGRRDRPGRAEPPGRPE
ncbi:hypothetical protein [Streptomyces spinosus]|uniref:hypothetical protein n=1 Tax=Streptomyces spinosus TaxID=2872623 RepID=UPI001CEDC04B|nr:hypothetical protein [Streptomyces spinosus]